MPISIDSTLRRIARQQEEAQAEALAARYGLSYAILDNYPFNIEVLMSIPIDICRERKVACYIHTYTKARIAVVNPEDPEIYKIAAALVEKWGGDTQLEFTVVSETTFHNLLENYAHLLQEREILLKQYKAQQDALNRQNYFKRIKSIKDLQQELNTASITEILDAILAAAVNQTASDIHLEPGETSVSVRFRIDGVLQKVLELPATQHHQLISRIKMLANIRLDEHNSSMDGRFSLSDKGINADIRVSIIPTGYGEGVVMRILRQDMKIGTLNDLGFSSYNQQLIEKAIRKPYGLILATGPTGSGKSTTLYTILQMVNSAERKIITLEDPIEYRIQGIQQSQVESEKGYTFAEGLRGILRQDPDIVMVGEIRDAETATIALNASLTGHLVLSTLHTNNAVAVHTRLLEMGIAPFLISGSIQMIIAQRLVRRLVPGSPPDNPQYKGRIVIGEVLIPSQEFEQAVLQKKDERTLQEIAIKGGMIPIMQDGLEKVRQGITTESEISRVTEIS
jgi:type IV pilus assembly protein PilB